MKEMIKRNISGRKVLLLFLLTNIVYAIMLTITIPKVMGFSKGMKILDMMPAGYNHTYVNALFSTLGTKGRNAYLFNQIPADLVYPGLFAISSCLVLGYFLNRLGKLEGSLIYLCYIPFFTFFLIIAKILASSPC